MAIILICTVNCQVAGLRWGEDVDHLQGEGKRPFDLIVASDVIWLDHLVEPLVDTLFRLITIGERKEAAGDDKRAHSRREVLLAHETRSLVVEQKFFRLMEQKGFVVHKVPFEEMHPEYRAKDISIYRFFLKSS